LVVCIYCNLRVRRGGTYDCRLVREYRRRRNDTRRGLRSLDTLDDKPPAVQHKRRALRRTVISVPSYIEY
jgi:hypothetical protein